MSRRASAIAAADHDAVRARARCGARARACRRRRRSPGAGPGVKRQCPACVPSGRPSSSTISPACVGKPARREEVPVVPSRQEARLLALGSTRGLEPRVRASSRVSSLVCPPSGNHTRSSSAGSSPASMYDWSLRSSARAGEQAAAPMFGDARVVARREARGPGAGGEGEQFGEAEAAVAADARVRRLAAGVAGDEGVHDGRAELAPEIERDMRQAEPVARLARGHDGLGEQQARSVSGPAGSSQSRSVTPTASSAARRSVTALSTPPLIATATRSASGGAEKTGPIAFASASTGSVSPPTAAASSSVSPWSGASNPSASASTIRSPSRPAAGHRPSRRSATKSPKTSTMRREYYSVDPSEWDLRPGIVVDHLDVHAVDYSERSGSTRRSSRRSGSRESPRPTQSAASRTSNVSRRHTADDGPAPLFPGSLARGGRRVSRSAGVAAASARTESPDTAIMARATTPRTCLDPDGNNIEALYRDEGNRPRSRNLIRAGAGLCPAQPDRARTPRARRRGPWGNWFPRAPPCRDLRLM